MSFRECGARGATLVIENQLLDERRLQLCNGLLNFSAMPWRSN